MVLHELHERYRYHLGDETEVLAVWARWKGKASRPQPNRPPAGRVATRISKTMKCPDCNLEVHMDKQLLGEYEEWSCPQCNYTLVAGGADKPLMHFLKQ